MIIFAIVIEAESIYKNNIDTNSEGYEHTVLFRLCDALCRLLVGSTNTTTSHDYPSSSSHDLVQKAKQLFKRAFDDSEYNLARILWKTFLRVANTEVEKNISNNQVFKPALIYTKTIYDMIPPSIQMKDEKSFFLSESERIMGGISVKDLDEWLKRDNEEKLVPSMSARFTQDTGDDSMSLGSNPQSENDFRGFNVINEENNSKESSGDHQSSKQITDENKLLGQGESLQTSSVVTKEAQSNQNVVKNENELEQKDESATNSNINDASLLFSNKKDNLNEPSRRTMMKRDTNQSQTQISVTNSELETSSDILTPLQSPNQWRSQKDATKYTQLLEQRIEAKQRGVIRSASSKSEISISDLAHEEVAKLERRIAAKSSSQGDIYSVSKFAMARPNTIRSESSNSSFYSNNTADNKVVYKTVQEFNFETKMKQKSENSVLSSHNSESNKSSDKKILCEVDDTLSIKGESFKSQKSEQNTNKSTSSFDSSSFTKSGPTDKNIGQDIAQDSATKADEDEPTDQESNAVEQNIPRDASGDMSLSEHDTTVTETSINNDDNDENSLSEGSAESEAALSDNQRLFGEDNPETHSLLLADSDCTERNMSRDRITRNQSSRSHVTNETQEPSTQSCEEENGIVFATAVEETDSVEDADNAVLYDPSAKRRIVTKKMRLWTVFAIVAAVGVAAALVIVFTKKNQPKPIITLNPTPPPTTSYYKTLKEYIHDEFGENKPYVDIGTAYGKALLWITTADMYILDATEKLDEIIPTAENATEVSNIHDHYVHDISLRFTFALFYYEMSGDQWLNCSASFSSAESTCSYLNHDLELVSNKKRWLSDDHICSWAGITCDVMNESVLRIELSKL